MDIKSLLLPDCVFNAVSVSSKKKLLQFISQIAAEKLNKKISEHDILEAFLSRERLGSTGIGQGIALPHGRLKDCNQALAFLITVDTPINFDAIDNSPVKIFFALLAPEDKCQDHLKSLAAVAEKLTDKAVVKKIKSATSNDELYQVFTE